MLLSVSLVSLRAQEVVSVTPDSLDYGTVSDTLSAVSAASETDTLFISDSLSSADTLSLADSLSVSDSLSVTDSLSLADAVSEIPLAERADWTESEKALLRSWRQRYPSQPSSEEAKNAAARDSLNPSALYLSVESLAPDPKLSYAQSDLRLPVIMDGRIPKPEAMTVADILQRQEQSKPSLLPFENSFSRQLRYGRLQHAAVHNYSSHHLNKVSMFRHEELDLPFERRRIQKQGVLAGEQVETGMGLQLQDAGLNIEQVTFHADKWHRTGITDLQMSQTALSENWYKGGENNLTISTYDKVTFKRYDENKITSLDISLELRLSGYHSKADTVHSMRVSDNSFRADISYGYKAWKNWYYSTSAYLKTPVFEYYNANSKVVKSTFLSPLECNVSIGMDLKLTSNKKCTYSLLLAPLSYNLKYVHDDRVSVTSYGIEAGKRSLNQFGATVTSKLEWTISNNLSWSSRAYYFTSYHNVQVEFENTFNFKLGHYCTAKFYLYPRFDDSVDSEVQMKETLTFGLAFVW